MRTPLCITAFLATFLSGAVFAQSPASSDSAAQPTEVTPLFDCYHINYAWGFSLSGRFIDRDGTVYSYTKPKKSWMAHEINERGTQYLSAADLQAKLAARMKIGTIDAATLAEKMALITAAAKGQVVPIDGGARDAGSSSCHAYIHDAANARYRDINLGSDEGISDVRTKNDSAEAQALLQWLGTIGSAQ